MSRSPSQRSNCASISTSASRNSSRFMPRDGNSDTENDSEFELGTCNSNSKLGWVRRLSRSIGVDSRSRKSKRISGDSEIFRTSSPTSSFSAGFPADRHGRIGNLISEYTSEPKTKNLSITFARYSPDLRHLAIACGNSLAIFKMDPQGLPIGVAPMLALPLTAVGNYAIEMTAISNEYFVVAGQSKWELFRLSAPGSCFTSQENRLRALAISPEQQEVAIAVEANRLVRYRVIENTSNGRTDVVKIGTEHELKGLSKKSKNTVQEITAIAYNTAGTRVCVVSNGQIVVFSVSDDRLNLTDLKWNMDIWDLNRNFPRGDPCKSVSFMNDDTVIYQAALRGKAKSVQGLVMQISTSKKRHLQCGTASRFQLVAASTSLDQQRNRVVLLQGDGDEILIVDVKEGELDTQHWRKKTINGLKAPLVAMAFTGGIAEDLIMVDAEGNYYHKSLSSMSNT